MEKVYLAALQMVQGIGNARLKSLISLFGSAQGAWQADKQALCVCKCLDSSTLQNLLSLRERLDIHKIAEQWKKEDITLYSINEADYPSLLRDIYDPPMVLYCRGSLPKNENCIAIVGSRNASAYGKNAANMLAGQLTEAGMCVVSGAAKGIDKAAHEGALTKGKTIAVLGCGVDIAYPAENRNLLRQIAENGAIISEYAPGTLPHPAYFPLRNRIINGISRGVVVIEAAQKSGALITADYALEEGRDVYSVPGSIFSASSKGTHGLLKQGAKLVDSALDILEEYNMTPCPRKLVQLTSAEKGVYDILPMDNPMCLEEIVIKSQLTAATVSYILLQLELRGLAMEHSGKCYTSIAQEGIR